MWCEQPSDCPRSPINRSLVGGAVLYFVEERLDIAARRSRKSDVRHRKRAMYSLLTFRKHPLAQFDADVPSGSDFRHQRHLVLWLLCYDPCPRLDARGDCGLCERFEWKSDEVVRQVIVPLYAAIRKCT